MLAVEICFCYLLAVEKSTAFATPNAERRSSETKPKNLSNPEEKEGKRRKKRKKKMGKEGRKEEEEGERKKDTKYRSLSILATFFLERPSQGVTWN